MLGAAVILLLVLLAIAGAKSYRDLATARSRERSLLERTEETRERIEALEERIERLRNDPVTLERTAREELGFVYPRDVVIVLPEKPAGRSTRGERVEPPG